MSTFFRRAAFANARRPLEETFRPGDVIAVDGVSIFASNFRDQALAVGELVDVSEMAREVGFIYPVALTAGLWADISAIPESHSHEDVNGRLWDVLYMAQYAVYQHPTGSSEIRYNLILHVGDTCAYQVKLVCEPGDDFSPILTLSKADKDIKLVLGEVTITEGALTAFVNAHASPWTYLGRHRVGDWGDCGVDIAARNDQAYLEGTRILSSYVLPQTQEIVWIMTEWDRSISTIMVPAEY